MPEYGIYLDVDSDGVYLSAPDRYTGITAAQHATYVLSEIVGSRHGGNAPYARMLMSASQWLHDARQYDSARGIVYSDEGSDEHPPARGQVADVFLILAGAHAADTFGRTGTKKMEEGVSFANDLAERLGDEIGTTPINHGPAVQEPERIHHYKGPSSFMQQRFCTDCGGEATGELPEGGKCPFCEESGTLI